jgi:hypothetical protein
MRNNDVNINKLASGIIENISASETEVELANSLSVRMMLGHLAYTSSMQLRR